jgi:hypothetical protein
MAGRAARGAGGRVTGAPPAPPSRPPPTLPITPGAAPLLPSTGWLFATHGRGQVYGIM